MAKWQLDATSQIRVMYDENSNHATGNQLRKK